MEIKSNDPDIRLNKLPEYDDTTLSKTQKNSVLIKLRSLVANAYYSA